MHKPSLAAVLAITLISSTIASAQNSSSTTGDAQPESNRPVADTLNKAGNIATQPVRDVGVNKRDIPDVLERAALDPYAVNGARTCTQISAAMVELNEVLGPDYVAGGTKKENRAGRLAEAGGTVRTARRPKRSALARR